MKLNNLSLMIVVICFSFFSINKTYSKKRIRKSIVFASVNKVFIPKGYDSNDNIEVVISGYFNSLCYKFNKIKTKIDTRRKIIKVGVTAIKTHKKNCLKVLVPFKEIVSLGILPHGKWKIYVNKNSLYHVESNFSVSLSDSELIDNHVYSSVDYVQYIGGNRFELFAFIPSSCFSFEKIEVYFNGKDTFSILPILRQDIDFCPYKMIHMSVPFEVDLSRVSGKSFLIHVRSLEGKSFNKVIYSFNE
jgi:hypothetical protein